MANTGEVRIIGGQWRGRRIAFPDAEGLRPSPDRVRETVFNWLEGKIRGTNCLDLFSGSGVLGFEALSRGAESATLVDKNPQAISSQKDAAEKLKASNVSIHKADVLAWLKGKPKKPYDIIFLDPPFHKDGVAPCLDLIRTQGWLAPEGWVYVEAEATQTSLPLGEHWVIHRSKIAGKVRYHIITRA